MQIIVEYRKLTEDIAVLRSKIKSKERELTKLTLTYAPADCKAMDYSKPQVQSSRISPDIMDLAGRIYEVGAELGRLRDEMEEILAQRDALDDCLDSLGDTPAKIMTLRIKGYTNRQIAYEMHISKRHVERLVSEVHKKIANY